MYRNLKFKDLKESYGFKLLALLNKKWHLRKTLLKLNHTSWGHGCLRRWPSWFDLLPIPPILRLKRPIWWTWYWDSPRQQTAGARSLAAREHWRSWGQLLRWKGYKHPRMMENTQLEHFPCLLSMKREIKQYLNQTNTNIKSQTHSIYNIQFHDNVFGFSDK